MSFLIKNVWIEKKKKRKRDISGEIRLLEGKIIRRFQDI